MEVKFALKDDRQLALLAAVAKKLGMDVALTAEGCAIDVKDVSGMLSLARTTQQVFEEATVPLIDKVKGIIVEQLGVDEDEVTPDASFTEDLGADSLDVVELTMCFEEEYGIDIPDEDAEKITRVHELLAYLERRLAAKKQAGG